jgi:hypothetical protein
MLGPAFCRAISAAMSAFGGKADITRGALCRLMAQSGHFSIEFCWQRA